MDERLAKLEEILKMEDVAEIFVDSIEATQKNLQAKGIDFSLSELKELAKFVNASRSMEELDEGTLESVVGGATLWRYIAPLIKLASPIIGPSLNKWR